jgi:hypothetical protein
MRTPASTTAGARDGTAAPPPALPTPLVEVSTLALRAHNRRVAAAPMSWTQKASKERT